MFIILTLYKFSKDAYKLNNWSIEVYFFLQFYRDLSWSIRRDTRFSSAFGHRNGSATGASRAFSVTLNILFHFVQCVVSCLYECTYSYINYCLNVTCSYVLEEYAAARRAAVVRSFLAALSGVGGMRPIEQSAHDSLRYAGDMLAALHLAAASENDLLESLLKQCPSTKGMHSSL